MHRQTRSKVHVDDSVLSNYPEERKRRVERNKNLVEGEKGSDVGASDALETDDSKIVEHSEDLSRVSSSSSIVENVEFCNTEKSNSEELSKFFEHEKELIEGAEHVLSPAELELFKHSLAVQRSFAVKSPTIVEKESSDPVSVVESSKPNIFPWCLLKLKTPELNISADKSSNFPFLPSARGPEKSPENSVSRENKSLVALPSVKTPVKSSEQLLSEEDQSSNDSCQFSTPLNESREILDNLTSPKNISTPRSNKNFGKPRRIFVANMPGDKKYDAATLSALREALRFVPDFDGKKTSLGRYIAGVEEASEMTGGELDDQLLRLIKVKLLPSIWNKISKITFRNLKEYTNFLRETYDPPKDVYQLIAELGNSYQKPLESVDDYVDRIRYYAEKILEAQASE